MQLVSKYVRSMPKTTTCEMFLRGVTSCIRKHYKKSMLPRLTEHPEDRLTCSAVVFSRVSREIWLVGDCHCLVGNQYIDNPKPAEAMLAAQRADEMKKLLAQGISQEELLSNDTARPLIIPHMIQTMKEQNITYSVIDGFHIPRQHVKVITLDFQPQEIVLASDGYPFLRSTLAESEHELAQLLAEDPLCIHRFKATKGLMQGNKWRLFVLDLSFIGWYIVGALVLGVGTLWVTPYHQATRAQFYEALVSQYEYGGEM